MLTADTITDEQIRELRTETMAEWSRRGKKTAWPEGKEILTSTIDALYPLPADPMRRRGRTRCAEILNAREAKP